ncbi:MAG: nucleotidyltransferase domain-containing protein [Clostridiales bacterium]|nr:nucleotidyltransferase domain-containing protein [Clostridiales bacterium]
MVAFTNRERIKEIAAKYAELLKRELDIESVYLAGSYAKGTNTEDSDIDIIVVSDSFSGDLIKDMLKLMKIRRELDYRIEPHPFTKSEFNPSNPFVEEILNTSIRIM